PCHHHRSGVQRVDPGHAGGVRPDPGDDEAVAPAGGGQVCGDGDVGTHPGQRPLRRAQVAGPVVEHHHPGRHYSTPFVLGTAPPARRSYPTAWRSARATALNCASTTWCASGCAPGRDARSTDTCSVILAVCPKDSHTCRVRLVGYTGPAYGASPDGSSCTTYGRPDRSTAACTSTSSSGTSAEPNRTTPALSPNASAKAVPRASAVSSTVWWASTSRSPTVDTRRSNPPCRPSCASMWS